MPPPTLQVVSPPSAAPAPSASMAAAGVDATASTTPRLEPATQASLPRLERASDYRALAQAKLAPDIWRYLYEGDDGTNTAALRSVRLMPRPLCPVDGGHTRLTLLGQALDHPLLLAPVAYQRLFHADGEAGCAMAAAAQGGQMLLSSLASQPFADVARAAREAGGQAPWFQLYWQGDRARTQAVLDLAVAAGCGAVVFTVDAPVKLASLLLPPGVRAVNLAAEAAPAALSHAGGGGMGGSAVFDGWMARAPSWDDVAWLRGRTQLPLLIKGVLHPDDAALAEAEGCDGVIVSNHGGRVLEGAALSLPALVAVAERLQGRLPVLFDSGIRGGRDAFVALAHGATAVLVGRPAIWGLASHGALGVAHVLRLMRDELELTMALTGCATLADIDVRVLAV